MSQRFLIDAIRKTKPKTFRRQVAHQTKAPKKEWIGSNKWWREKGKQRTKNVVQIFAKRFSIIKGTQRTGILPTFM